MIKLLETLIWENYNQPNNLIHIKFFIYFCYFIVYLSKKYNLKIFNLIKLSLLEIQTKIDI